MWTTQINSPNKLDWTTHVAPHELKRMAQVDSPNKSDIMVISLHVDVNEWPGFEEKRYLNLSLADPKTLADIGSLEKKKKGG